MSNQEMLRDKPQDESMLATSQPKKWKLMEKRSEVWNHCEPFKDEHNIWKAKCKHCGKNFCGDTKKNGTTSLHAHIKTCKKILQAHILSKHS